ncbi:phage scaffolding protein [Aquitalea magnusonii]|uniref:Minor structural protein GP20 n=1 Tax=Aquitalea magnusonii TaxID=332411 RepID=A0A318J3J5_9NEIS|nr:phage scaffolding protein [Aquitalea magnusonii]PXX42223.1 minor structural protein GP20 [Aquitalea magnusonii]
MSDPANNPEPQSFSAEYVRELRAENKGLRLKNTELQGKVDGFEQATAEAVKKAIDEAAPKIREAALAEASAEADKRVLQAELKSVAVKSGLLDLDQLKLLDLSAVKFADGKIEGAEALFAGLKESKPYLFGEQSSTSSTETAPKPKPAEAKQAKDMTTEEYAAAKAALLKG